MTAPTKGLLTLAVAAMHLSGCAYHSWKPATVEVPAVLQGTEPDALRMTLVDGTTVTILDPWITADSIVGEGGRVAIADVEAVQTRELNATGTLVGVALVGALAVGVAYLLVLFNAAGAL